MTTNNAKKEIFLRIKLIISLSIINLAILNRSNEKKKIIYLQVVNKKLNLKKPILNQYQKKFKKHFIYLKFHKLRKSIFIYLVHGETKNRFNLTKFKYTILTETM